MARDKLITIRIEGEKREAFNNLAKSQNTDTASLLYDFINQCLSGTLDISLVTGKGNRIDKIDNQIGSDRIDKLETATQEIDNRLGKLSKKLTDWIEAFDDRLNDCDQGLSNKITSLEHRLNTLAIQLDSQQDRQGETPDIEPVATVETAIDTVKSVDEPDQPAIETVTPEVSPSPPSPPGTVAIGTLTTVETDSTIEPVTDAIGTVPGETDSSIETVTDAIELTNKEKAAILGIDDSNLSKWVRNGEIPKKHGNKCRFNENKTKIILI